MSPKDFTTTKLEWLEQLAMDDELPGAAYRIGMLFATIFMNREKGYAWPSMTTLANRLNMSERGVQKAIRVMVEKGHLEIEAGGGRATANRYQWILKPRTAVQGIDEKPRTAVQGLEGEETPNGSSENPELSFVKPRTPVHPTPFEEPFDEPFEGNPPNPLLGKGGEQAALEVEFEEWWGQYPRQKAKGTARRAYRKAREKADAATLLSGAMRYAAEAQSMEGQFVKHPSSWLNAECWNDSSDRSPNKQSGFRGTIAMVFETLGATESAEPEGALESKAAVPRKAPAIRPMPMAEIERAYAGVYRAFRKDPEAFAALQRIDASEVSSIQTIQARDGQHEARQALLTLADRTAA
jgi:hypothetical protein